MYLMYNHGKALIQPPPPLLFSIYKHYMNTEYKFITHNNVIVQRNFLIAYKCTVIANKYTSRFYIITTVFYYTRWVSTEAVTVVDKHTNKHLFAYS